MSNIADYLFECGLLKNLQFMWNNMVDKYNSLSKKDNKRQCKKKKNSLAIFGSKLYSQFLEGK